MSENDPTLEELAKKKLQADLKKGEEETKAENLRLKEELGVKTSQLGTIAFDDFKKTKSKLLAKIKDEKKRQYVDETIGNDPDMLKQTQLMVKVFKESGAKIVDDDPNPEDVTTPPPKGIAGLPRAGNKASGKELLDELFKILGDKNASVESQVEANRRVNIFYRSLYAGRRQGILSGKSSKYDFAMSKCSHCGKMIMGRRGEELRSCPHCKTRFTERR